MPGFIAAIAGSFHSLILPRKISASSGPVVLTNFAPVPWNKDLILLVGFLPLWLSA